MSDALIYPLLVQVALTFALLIANGLMRSHAVGSGAVKPVDIVLGQRAWPQRVQQVSNAFQNQMETPTLFYVGVVLAVILEIGGPVLLGLACLWSGLRLLHAYVHVTSNHLRWRFLSFVAGVIILMAFWAVLVVGLVTR